MTAHPPPVTSFPALQDAEQELAELQELDTVSRPTCRVEVTIAFEATCNPYPGLEVRIPTLPVVPWMDSETEPAAVPVEKIMSRPPV